MNFLRFLPHFSISLLLCLCVAARAHDHSNLEEGIPLEIEDSYAASYLSREFQLASRFERTAEGKDVWMLVPRLEVGLPVRNSELSLSLPFEFGSAVAEEGLRNIGVELLYNFNTEGKYLPAFAIAGEIEFPTGNGPEGVDTALKFIATRTIGWTSLLQRAYFNAAWLHNDDPQPHERDDRYKIVVGYAVHAGADTMILADYIHEQELERGVTSNIAELGVRRMLNPLTVIAVGAGVGLDNDSPDFRIRFGLQKSF